eukprot:5204963-Heterocapsa_arctica.AAC.1
MTRIIRGATPRLRLTVPSGYVALRSGNLLLRTIRIASRRRPAGRPLRASDATAITRAAPIAL